LVKARGKQRTDATYVLAAIRVLNRLEMVAETLRATLNELATIAPDWLREVVPAVWYERYGRRIEEDRLPQSKDKRDAYAQTVGEDGFLLLELLTRADAPAIDQLQSVKVLRRMWDWHYERPARKPEGTGSTPPQVRLKPSQELPPAAGGLESPYELDARFRRRYATHWTGYQVHLTESCDDKQVHLITHVETTEATVHESQKTQAIHQALVDKQLPPDQHLVDSAYIDAELLINSRTQFGITLVGPGRPDSSWQAKVEGGYDRYRFEIDWDQQQVRCPQGQTSVSWEELTDQYGLYYRVSFDQAACLACPARALCTRAKTDPRRLRLQSKDQYQALQAARQLQTSPAGQKLYAKRAGIEGTISQGVRAFGLRQARYRGLAKTHVQNLATAAAINLDRLAAWFDERPQAQTRTSRFARLAPLAV
jgi:transposase